MRSINTKLKNKDFTKSAQSVTIGMILSMSIVGTAWGAPATNALPTGQQNITGATITDNTSKHPDTPTMTIAQDANVNTGYITWNTFNIGREATVNFKQQSSGQTMVNSVLQSGGLSEIYGKMNATGNVVLINPNGVVFNGAAVNVGGLAVYATSSMDATEFNKDLTQGNITIINSTITAGIGDKATMAKNMGITDYAVGLAANSNKIRLVADGSVNLNGATLTAVDKSIVSGDTVQGVEAFEMGGNASVAYGQVIIRSDANADDYGTVTISNNNMGKKITTTESHIFYNPTSTAAETPNELGAASGITYNKKDYENTTDFDSIMNTTPVSRTIVTTDSTKLYENSTINTVDNYIPIGSANAKMLVNNIAQLQDIDEEGNDKGNLGGNYALGKDINATADKASYNETVTGGYTIIYKDNGTGKITASSVTDNGVFTTSKTKTTGDYTIAYDSTATSVATTVATVEYSYKGESGVFYAKGTKVNDPSLLDATMKTDLITAFMEFTNAAKLSDVGTTSKSINSANWNQDTIDNKVYHGFNPIGNGGTNGAFTGFFDGFGGDATHTISNLTINRPTEDNVGLFAVVGATGNAGSITRAFISKGKITGQNSVGSIAGQLTNGSTLSWSHALGDGINGTIGATSGYVKVAETGGRTNIGGLVGSVTGSSTIYASDNSTTVIGQTDDEHINVTNVGGIAGYMEATSKATNITNAGNVFGEEATGGLVGYGTNSEIGVDSTVDNLTAASFNRGQVTGTKHTGGIIGHANNMKLHGVYNTNEDTALSANSQYSIQADGTIISQNPDAKEPNTTLKDNDITSDAALSKYGKVTGVTNTGGIAGFMEGTGSNIDTAYNAGNITGTDNTGGLVGNMTGGTIVSAYNGDNNTVIRETLPSIPNEVLGTTTVSVGGVDYKFYYNAADAAYYSFYTADTAGNKTYYYFKSVGDATTKGAGGIYVDANGDYVADGVLPKEYKRYYLNRVGYKDANVTGTTYTGGLVGAFSGGSMDAVYNIGSVKGGAGGTDTTTTGAIAGVVADRSKVTNSFWVSGKDNSIGKKYSNTTNAFGTTSTGTAAGTFKEYTLAKARDKESLTNDFGTTFLGTVVKEDGASGYGIYTQGSTTYYFDNTSTIYTYDYGTRKFVSAYTKVETGDNVGKYQDKDGKLYTFAVSADNLSFSLTKVVGGSVATFNGVTETSNQNMTWLAYQDQTTPLLKYFMNTTNINRVFLYDGTTHNLKTDDVNNLYGRADFSLASGAGRVVNGGTSYEKSDQYTGSSEYYYDNSSIWSPQHGYKMNPKAAVVILPVPLKITLSGNKTYGDINNLKGYYVSVPYYDKDADGNNVGDTHYAFYTVDKVGTTWQYTLLKDTALTNFFTGYSQNQSGIQKKADHDGKYLVTMDGIVNLETTNIDAAVAGFVKAVGGGTTETGDDFTGAVWNKNGTKTTDTQQLNAGSYGFNTTEGASILEGVTAQNDDYTITYDGNLKIAKETLYYTYDGIRDYGATNDTGTKTYTLVGTDDESTTKSVDGLLKSFDKDKITISPIMKNEDGTWTMTGTVATGNANITANGTQSITQGSSGDNYYEVMVDSSGQVLGYVLKTLDSGTMKLVGKTVEGKDYTTELNNNYNLVWHVGETNVTVNSTEKGKTGIQTATIDVNDSTQKIKPVELTVTVSGNRYYGDQMSTDSYSTTDASTVDNRQWNVALSGLTEGDKNKSSDILNAAKIQTILNDVESTYVSAADNFISDHTNVGSYNVKDGTTLTKSSIDLGAVSANHSVILAAKNYNYLVVNDKNTLDIKARPVTLTATADRTYGDDNTSIANKSLTQSGLTTWDSGTGSTYANKHTDWQTGINVTNANIDQKTDVGTYGTLGTTNKDIALGYAAVVDIAAALATNYTVTYADKLTITPATLKVKVIGTKIYGTVTATSGSSDQYKTGGVSTGDSTITGTGFKNNQTFDPSQLTITNGVTTDDNVGTYKKGSTTNRITGISSSESTTGGFKAGNYTLVLDEDNSQFEVTKRDLVLTTKTIGDAIGKTYGEGNPSTSTYVITADPKTDTTGFTDKDKANTIANTGIYAGWQSSIDNTTDEKSDAGNYGTLNGTGTVLKLDVGATTSDGTALSHNYNITYKDSFKIGTKAIKITVKGNKIYGEDTINGTNTGNVYEVTADALQNGDKFDTSLVNITNNVGKEANAGTYTSGTTPAQHITGASNFVNDKANTDAGNHEFKAANYTVTFDTDKSQYDVTKRSLELTTSGSKTYGDADPANSEYTINDTTVAGAGKGLTSWDKTATIEDSTNYADWQNNVANSTDVTTNAGKYGTGNGSTKVLTLNGTTVGDTTSNGTTLSNNYDIKYVDKFDVNKRKITVTQTGTKEYGTGSEHSTYSEVGLDNVANGQETAIKNAVHNSDSSNRTTNVGSYKNTDGKDNGMLTVGLSGIDDILANYDVTYDTTMNVTPADFTYTSDHTEYWQGTPIPAQTGKVTNRFGEDVSDLVGKTSWDTPADTYTPGIYPIWGHGANDFTGNYNPLQSTDPNNAKALKIKDRPADMHTDEVQAFGLVRRPMLDIRYLELVGTEGVNRWISTNDLGTKSTTTLYDKKKNVKYQF